ncbi:MAG TPA: hypothetical protein VL860_08675, partial [Planctomycetota bacterium]|nr:hypothetical protein [Planctomycetota bacterium]
ETAPEVKEHLELVPFGVKRLMEWAQGKKRVWCCIECTGIDNVNRKPTPKEIRSEVWQALIQGANGIIWFSHEFKPNFKEAAPLDDPPTLAAMTTINGEIKDLAAVLNAPVAVDGARVSSADAKVPVAVTTRKMPDAIYVFAAASKPGKTDASITVPAAGGVSGGIAEAEVLGENRKVALKGGVFVDEFKDWDVHLYKLVLKKNK